MTNVVVTQTRNDVVFSVDNKTYNDAVKKIRKLKKEWEGVGNAAPGGSSRGRGAGPSARAKDPAAQHLSAAKQMAMVNKRLAETRKREETRATSHRIALAKKEARANDVIAKQSAARIRQHMSQMTGTSPESSKMRKFYQDMEKSSKKSSAGGSTWQRVPASQRNQGLKAAIASQAAQRAASANPDAGREADFARAIANQQYAQRVAQREAERQARIAANPAPAVQKVYPKAGPNTGPQRNVNPAANAAAKQASRVNDVISTNAIRLTSRYGANYQSKLGTGAGTGGISKLNSELQAGTLSVRQYGAHLSALEKQFRSNQSAAVSFGGALKDIRGSLVGIGAAYGVFNAGKSIMQQGQFFQGLNAQMALVSDTPEQGAAREKFIKDQAYRLGLDLPKAAEGYTQMAISGQGQITDQQTNDLFKGYSEFATASGVDPVKYQRGITAIGQMLGKGQIMAEELKSQLAEGIPGSLQVFVKAAQEAFGDTTIDVEKLMDKMQAGELKAAKVLPFVAKYYAEAARKGGALDKALNGNRVAAQRLTLTWKNFQNEIFMGGFGDQLTKMFNDLARVIDTNSPLARNIGEFFSNMMEGAWDMVTYVTNVFTLFSRVLDHYATEWGIKGETMSKIFDWAGYIAGVVLFTSFVAKLFGWLSRIAGLAGALKLVRDAVNGTGGGGDDAGGDPKKTKGKGFGRGLGPGGYAAIIGTAIGLGDTVFDQAADSSDNWYGKDTIAGGNLKANSPLGALWSAFTNPNTAFPTNWGTGMGYVTQQNTNPFPYPADPANSKPVDGTINIKIDAGELAKYMKTVVDEQNGYNFNLLTQGGNN